MRRAKKEMATEKIKVSISNRQKDVKIPTGMRLLIRRCCNAVLKMENFKGSAEISVSFLNNDQIRQLNNEYRGKDMPTDVLSFPLGENGVYDINEETGAAMLGDIVISMQKAVEQAQIYGHSLQREVGAGVHIGSDLHIIRDDRLVHHCAVSDHDAGHENGIPYHGSLSDLHAHADDRIVNLSVYFGPLRDDAPLDHRIGGNILRRKDIAFGIDFPELFIQVEDGNNVYQLHIGLPVGAQRSHVLPVAIVLVGKDPVTASMAVGNDMLSEITARFVGHLDQSFLQYLPAEDIDSHARQIASRMLRLLLEQ